MTALALFLLVLIYSPRTAALGRFKISCQPSLNEGMWVKAEDR